MLLMSILFSIVGMISTLFAIVVITTNIIKYFYNLNKKIEELEGLVHSAHRFMGHLERRYDNFIYERYKEIKE